MKTFGISNFKSCYGQIVKVRNKKLEGEGEKYVLCALHMSFAMSLLVYKKRFTYHDETFKLRIFYA